MMAGVAVNASGQSAGNAGIVVEAPQPVSEYAEKTGPNQITFLSYPKYYKSSEGSLVPVNTTLVPSKDPDWDYEVTAGIWALKVRKDGTFQAKHEGDIFTYRLNSMGVGRGSSYKAFDQGEPNFKNYQVQGDTIRWNDVFPQVDLSVRYINDILKVDVIVKKERIREINALVQKGGLRGDDFLTARFDIPQIFIRSQAMLGNEKLDLYTERFELGAMPLQFVKDGKTVHKLRPVEIQLEDDNGKEIQPYADQKLVEKLQSVKTAQAWQLKKDGAGIAEMSMSLADLAGFQDVNVVIDPTAVFKDTNVADAYIDSNVPDMNYGSQTFEEVGSSSLGERRFLISFKNIPETIGNGCTIFTVSLGLMAQVLPNSIVITRAFKVKNHDWDESSVTWNNYKSGNNQWTIPGGDFDLNCYSDQVTLTSTTPTSVYYNVTTPFISHYYENSMNLGNRGFLIRSVNIPNSYCRFESNEGLPISYRPRLLVGYKSTVFGADAGSAWSSPTPNVTTRQQRMKEDKLNIIRLFSQGVPLNDLIAFVNTAYSNNMEVIMVLPCGPVRFSTQVSDIAGYWSDPGPRSPYTRDMNGYANWVEDRLNAVSSYINGTISKTVAAVELGNEEDKIVSGMVNNATRYYTLWPRDATYAISISEVNNSTPKMYSGGSDFASFYIVARDKIKTNWPNLEIISGGSIVDDKTLSYGDNPNYLLGVGQYARAFICGFIDGVTMANSGSLSKLPDIISIHGYNTPEAYHESPPGGSRGWFKRLKNITSTCNRGEYKPFFDITEYAYSAYTPLDEKKQAFWYLRRALLDATIQNDIGNRQWHRSLYFHHPAESTVASGNLLGMHKEDLISPRIIRKIASTITSVTPGLGISEYVSWFAPNLDATTPSDTNNYDVKTINCGWKSPSGEKWGAIWRYGNGEGFYGTHWYPYGDLSGDTRYFWIPEITAKKAYLYRFQFGGTPPSYSNTQFNQIDPLTGITGTQDGTKTRYVIPGVDEEPILIRIAQ